MCQLIHAKFGENSRLSTCILLEHDLLTHGALYQKIGMHFNCYVKAGAYSGVSLMSNETIYCCGLTLNSLIVINCTLQTSSPNMHKGGETIICILMQRDSV